MCGKSVKGVSSAGQQYICAINQRPVKINDSFRVLDQDPCAFHSAIPKPMAEGLRPEVAGEISVTLDDKPEVKAPIALAYLRVLDRESIVPVIIIDVPKPLMGVSALESLGLKVDPVAGNVEHSRPFGAALL